MQTRDFLSLIAWEMINPVALRLKRKRLYEFRPEWTGANLGCGLDCPPGWVGLDGGITHVVVHSMPTSATRVLFPAFRMARNHSFADYTRRLKAFPIIHHELRFGIPFRSDTVPHIYSSHFLEHLTREDARGLLRECYRVLRPQGMIRICVPSLETEIDRMRTALDAYEQGDLQPIQRWVTDDRTGFFGPYSHHRFMYSAAELTAALREAGFREPVEWTFRQGSIPDVDQLDTRPGIYIEALKA